MVTGPVTQRLEARQAAAGETGGIVPVWRGRPDSPVGYARLATVEYYAVCTIKLALPDAA